VNDTSLQYLILRCYGKWVEFLNKVLDPQERLEFLGMSIGCPVLAGALNSLQSEELQERAQQLVRQIVSLIPKD
jgi:hypothetical protein